jgi:hypothetical protein
MPGLSRRATANAGASVAIGLALWLPAPAAWAEWPMYYLETFGPRGEAIADLTWGLLALALGVVLIIGILVLIGVFARRYLGGADEYGRLPIERGGRGVRWI